MTFDVTGHMMKLKNKDYLPVPPRIAWFLEEHPEGDIETECVFANEEQGLYRFRAIVTFDVARKDGTVKSVRRIGHGSATRKEFPTGPAEKSETKALGRALAFAGYGTLAAQDIEDDGESSPADSPIERGRPAQASRPGPAQQSRPASQPAQQGTAPSAPPPDWTAQKFFDASVKLAEHLTKVAPADNDFKRMRGLYHVGYGLLDDAGALPKDIELPGADVASKEELADLIGTVADTMVAEGLITAD